MVADAYKADGCVAFPEGAFLENRMHELTAVSAIGVEGDTAAQQDGATDRCKLRPGVGVLGENEETAARHSPPAIIGTARSICPAQPAAVLTCDSQTRKGLLFLGLGLQPLDLLEQVLDDHSA